jgi:hypothetical protein
MQLALHEDFSKRPVGNFNTYFISLRGNLLINIHKHNIFVQAEYGSRL